MVWVSKWVSKWGIQIRNPHGSDNGVFCWLWLVMAGCSRSVASCCTCASCSSRPCTAGTTRSQSTGEKTHRRYFGFRWFSILCAKLSADLLRLFCGLRPFLSSISSAILFSRLGFLHGPFSISFRRLVISRSRGNSAGAAQVGRRLQNARRGCGQDQDVHQPLDTGADTPHRTSHRILAKIISRLYKDDNMIL